MIRILDPEKIGDFIAIRHFCFVVSEVGVNLHVITNYDDEQTHPDEFMYNIDWGFLQTHMDEKKLYLVGVPYSCDEYPVFLITEVDDEENTVLEFTNYLRSNYPQYINKTPETYTY
jgi:hypothetical protein